jgi:peptide deformylase
MKKILQKMHPALRIKSRHILLKDISKPRITKLIKDMFETLAATDNGVALAAPQIGVNERLFVISPKIRGGDGEPIEHLIYINPTIVKRSSKKEIMQEGCLSVENIYGEISRAKKTTIEAYDEKGVKFSEGRSGLISEIFQHETDHLDGILFIDTAKDLHEIPPESPLT